MSANAKQLETEAMKLSPEERAQLADKLWLSLEEQSNVDAAWSKEIEHRIRQLEDGTVMTVAHQDVIAEMRARYGK
jgi:putative addiction module component (TIGR02574 family)